MIAGIDIGSSSIKLVQARRGKGGRLQITNAAAASLGELAAMPEDSEGRIESTAAVLRQMLSQSRAAVSRAYTSVSGKRVITRYTHVPPMPHDRLAKVMAFEIENETPAGGGEIASDFILLDLPNKAAEFTILVGMAKEEVIRQQNEIFQSASVGVEDISIGCLATFNCFVNAKKDELESMDGPCAIVNVGFDKMEVAVAFGKNLYFARTLSPGGNIFTEILQQELKVPYDRAEQIKRERGRIVPQTPAHMQPEAKAQSQVSAPPETESPLEAEGKSEPAEKDESEARGESEEEPLRILDTDNDEIPLIPVIEADASGSPDEEDTSLGVDDDVDMIPVISQGSGASGESGSAGQAGATGGAGLPDESRDTGGDNVNRLMETAAHNLVNSLRSCLRHVKVQTKLPELQINRIYLTGGGAQLPGLCQHMQQRLGIETVMLDPLENVDYSACKPEVRQLLESDRHAFATAIGLAAPHATDAGLVMSLLPKAVKQHRKFMQQGVYATMASVIFGITILAMGLSSYFAAKSDAAYIKDQNAGIKTAERAEKELEELEAKNADFAAKVDRMRELMTENRTRLAALAVLKKLVPPQFELAELRTYSSAPPAYRTVTTHSRRRTHAEEEKTKPPKVMVLAGRVPGIARGELSGEEMQNLLRDFAEEIRHARGPFGKRLFSNAETRRASAEEGSFEIEITVAEDEGEQQ